MRRRHRYVTPFETDEYARGWMHHQRPPQRRRRTEVFLDGYGIELDLHQVSALVAERCRLTTRHVHHLAGLGVQPQLGWTETGVDAKDAEHGDWNDENGSALLE